MARRKNPKKGGQFEREFCKRISLWWTNGHHDDRFWRSSNSGGRATVRAWQKKSTHMQAGDVAAIHPEGEPLIRVMTFELKRGYPKANIHDVLDRTTQSIPLWLSFWKSAALAAKRNNSLGHCLVTRRDRHAEMIWLPQTICAKLRSICCTPWPPIQFRLANNEVVYGDRLDNWLTYVSPSDILDVYGLCYNN